MKTLVALMLLMVLAGQAFAGDIRVGSKKFTESVILGEIITGLLRDGGATVEHQRELGGTRILWNALRAGDLDLYPDYTGTLRHEILAGESPGEGLQGLRAALKPHGLGISAPLGFNNSYALGMLKPRAAELGITRNSDL
ncbi:MAG: glycine betaine ABC transporter substrate-binding protein, partial [Gammaproteobacteria bacterium]